MHEETLAVLSFSFLPALALLLPLVGAAGAAVGGERRPRLRNWSAVLSTGFTLVVVASLLARVTGKGPVYFELGFLRLGERFSCGLEVDAVGAFFALFASILWFAASLHAFRYMDHEHKRTRFFIFMLLTESATLGVFMVQDFFSLYLFFEAMGFLAYLLVIHSETPRARAAAAKYMGMTVIGGLSLIGGVFLYLGYAGTTSFRPLMESAWLTGPFKVAAVVMLIAGFGVKAGMVPLHVWLPDAHPAAPSPASALLSGVMIKAGAYGILRTALSFLQSPVAHGAEGQAAAGHGVEAAVHAAGGLAADVRMLGFAVIWIGVTTMFLGMLLALVQRDIKRTLAYSSVSQMGYILFGVGCLGYLGAEGAMGMGGSLYHIINHAFFKGCFFLAAGSVLFCAHELDMFKLGGLWRRMPLTTLFWCIAALGIMGIPLGNGFVSKTLLHHAILESHHLAEGARLATAGWVKAAETMFIITSGGTIGYITKMTYYTFFRRPDPEHASHLEHVREAPAWMLAGTGLLAAGVLFNGLFPGLLMRRLVGPAAGTVPGLEALYVEHLAHTTIFLWSNIKEIFVPLAIGLSVFVLGAWPDLFRVRRRGPDLFQLRLPRWLGVDFWYLAAARGSLRLLFWGKRNYAPVKENVVALCRRGAAAAVHAVREVVYPSLTTRPASWVSRQALLLYGNARRELLPRIREYQGDIAVGALVIAVSLTLFLIMRLM
ncbi:complex I subunit 5 family protein [Candidatus Solincola tengchongensis]|uniref:complex I subunit 5 family protein n=1 Tax=Candidatus Solincola tengchongensis TaxID=2900693 RepID=UPI00257C1410